MYLRGKLNVNNSIKFGGKKKSKIDAQEAKRFKLLVPCMDPTISTMQLSSHVLIDPSNITFKLQLLMISIISITKCQHNNSRVI